MDKHPCDIRGGLRQRVHDIRMEQRSMKYLNCQEQCESTLIMVGGEMYECMQAKNHAGRRHTATHRHAHGAKIIWYNPCPACHSAMCDLGDKCKATFGRLVITV